MTKLEGRQIDRYKILNVTGEGGMAVVYKAINTRLDSEVAVKVIRTERLAPEIAEKALKRFEREAKSLAQLTHANIVGVMDYGEHDGQPYLVMEYLRGGSLKKLLGKPMPWQEAARLLLPIARALEYAHKRNIIHRDVKPSNIILNESGQPMLVDFGIAKVIEEDMTVDLTGTRGAIGTPEYMSPEQGLGKAVDARTDIYALGVVFYELVTGRKPFIGDTPMETLFKHVNEPLPRPRAFIPNLPAEVEDILLKSLAKQAQDRFADMGEFADFIEAIIDGDLSEYDGTLKRTTGNAKENQTKDKQNILIISKAGNLIPMMVIGGLVIGGLVIVFSVIMGISLIFGKSPDINTTTIPTQKPKKTDIPSSPFESNISPENVRQVGEIARLGKGSVTNIAYSLDGKYIAVASSFGIYLYDAITFEQIHFFLTNVWITSVALSPDGKTLAYVSDDNTVKLLDVDSRQEIFTLRGHTDRIGSVTFSPDGRLLASGSYDNTVKLWDVGNGRELLTLKGHTGDVNKVAFSPNGELIASGSDDGKVRIWDVNSGEEIRKLSGAHNVHDIAFSPDGKTLASAENSDIKLWDVTSGEELLVLIDHNSSIDSIAFSPDGNVLAFGSHDMTIRLWSVHSRRELFTLRGHTDWVRSVAFSPDGKNIASGSYDATMRVWDVISGQELRIVNGTDRVRTIAVSPDGNTLASGSDDDTIKLWDVDSGKEILILSGHTGDINSVAFSPYGEMLASGSNDDTIKLWDVDSGRELLTLNGHTSDVNSVAFSPNGKMLASGSFDNAIKLWDVDSGQELLTLTGLNSINSVVFSPNGENLASVSTNGSIKLWDVNSGRELLTLSGHPSYVYSVAFSPDGKTLVSGSGDYTVKLWDVSNGRELLTLNGHTDDVKSVAFSPNGDILASGSNDNTIKLWDVDNGMELFTLNGHTGSVNSIIFSPDGNTLASGSTDGTIRLWAVTEN